MAREILEQKHKILESIAVPLMEAQGQTDLPDAVLEYIRAVPRNPTADELLTHASTIARFYDDIVGKE